MQTALGIIGLILVYCAVMMRFRRKEDYQHDLEQADYERKTAQFWDMSTKFEDERIAEIKKEGYGNWKTRLKFNAGFWTMAIIGSILLLGVYLNQEPDLNSSPWVLVVLGGGLYLSFKYLTTIERLEKEIRWLNMMLKNVKDHSEGMRKASIEQVMQLRVELGLNP